MKKYTCPVLLGDGEPCDKDLVVEGDGLRLMCEAHKWKSSWTPEQLDEMAFEAKVKKYLMENLRLELETNWDDVTVVLKLGNELIDRITFDVNP